MEESFDSPSGIADLVRDEMISPVDEDFEVSLPGITEQSTSRDSEDYPSDENNPAEDSVHGMSPLPFREDPTSLMELPEDLLKLPISPVGPQDES